MIGLVVVSHSHALAGAALALASEMLDDDGTGSPPAVEIAAGLDEQTFGTDALAVSEAIGRADEASGGDGVLVLLDLGSAVLSADMALELVEPAVAGRTLVCSAPLVEGLVAALVTAAGGADLATVAAEAARGLVAKQEHLGDGPNGQAPSPPLEGLERRLEVTAVHGLHARPAARFVACVNAHPDVQVRVLNPDSGRGPVDGRSLSGIATLDARQGHHVLVTVSAPSDQQASDLLDALEELAGSGFGDDPKTADAGSASAQARSAPLAPGSGLDAAIGPAVLVDAKPDLTAYRAGRPEQEQRRLQEAIRIAQEELIELEARTDAELGPAAAAIFAAHTALLHDPGLWDPVRAAVADGTAAPDAVQRGVRELAEEFAGLSEAYQRDRAADVRSVGDRVLRALGGANAQSEHRPGVLVVDELDPATAASIDGDQVAGVATLRGGATGHGVILARARGVPVLTGASGLSDVSSGTLIALDVRNNRLLVDPDEQVQAQFSLLLEQRAARQRQVLAGANAAAVTTDGRRVAVKANVGSLAEARSVAAAGAEGSGLVRTETLFARWQHPPTVAEQVEVLTEVAEALGAYPMTVRTWDVGGDKPVPFLPLPAEPNPFLGVRGVRACQQHPVVLLDQLEAICRVAQRHPVRVMVPMVATVAEVDWALARLDEAAARLGNGRPDGLEVGVMIEVPAAALRAEAISAQLDFVSIGSNDLTQYTLAADRGNPGVAQLSDAMDPAVLALVRHTVDGVADGVSVGVCGDLAGDPQATAVLIGLGVEELSATAASIAEVKATVREHDLTTARDLAERALRCDSAAEVRALLRS